MGRQSNCADAITERAETDTMRLAWLVEKRGVGKMNIALYRGIGFWPSRCIEWFSRSPYSHAAFVFDDGAARVAQDLADSRELTRLYCRAPGATVEAWSGGVKCSPGPGFLHTPGTPVDILAFSRPLEAAEERALILLLDSQIGIPYDYWDIIRFVTRRQGNPGGRLFCSELVAQDCQDIGRPLFRATESWRVPPDWIARTNELRLVKSITT